MNKDLMRAVLITTIKTKFPLATVENGYWEDEVEVRGKKFKVTYLENYLYKVESHFCKTQYLNFSGVIDLITSLV